MSVEISDTKICSNNSSDIEIGCEYSSGKKTEPVRIKDVEINLDKNHRVKIGVKNEKKIESQTPIPKFTYEKIAIIIGALAALSFLLVNLEKIIKILTM